jgi:hypothetical protein
VMFCNGRSHAVINDRWLSGGGHTDNLFLKDHTGDF